jgi:hypothetical protein
MGVLYMSYCPCCSRLLLQHICGSGTYWFCRHCWQEMPAFDWEPSALLSKLMIAEFSISQSSQENSWTYVNTNKLTQPPHSELKTSPSPQREKSTLSKRSHQLNFEHELIGFATVQQTLKNARQNVSI